MRLLECGDMPQSAAGLVVDRIALCIFSHFRDRYCISRPALLLTIAPNLPFLNCQKAAVRARIEELKLARAAREAPAAAAASASAGAP